MPQVVIEEMLSDYPRHYKLAWQARHSISRNGPSSSQCNKKSHNLLFLHETSNGMERVIQKFQKKSWTKNFVKKVSWPSDGNMTKKLNETRPCQIESESCEISMIKIVAKILFHRLWSFLLFSLDGIMTVNLCFCVISAGCYEAFYGRS